ncbi:cohesin domain-containing protein [Ruminococcus sp. HUN007]|jgi:hypothetical protein|uniref:cohesin domain-containing protein n=1 Tax=Ruminococcus sp. HUN007 TaxID=1514668 RepID=UPI0005D1E8CB|nr:cohesin domain-containing protein [Ruminococcus sp. HUN007]
MKFNKAAACLIATACTASLFSTVASVSAADAITIGAESKAVESGKEFTVDISLAGVPSSGIAGLDFAIKYDTSLMEVTGVTEGAVSKTNDKQVEGFSSNLATNINNGAVSVLWATGSVSDSSKWIKSDGVLLTLNCKALKDGEAKVDITKGVRKDAEGIDIAVEGLAVVNGTAKAGTVSIGPKTTTEPSPTTKPTETTAPGAKLLGDVDCDGKVDITDITTLAISLVDKKPLTGDSKINADVDGDGDVALTDLARIKQFVSKVIDKL